MTSDLRRLNNVISTYMYLVFSPSCAGLQSAHRTRHLLHSSLSIASSSFSSHDTSRHLNGFCPVLPLLFLPSGTQCNTCLIPLSLSMRNMWPSHFNLLFLMMFSISSY